MLSASVSCADPSWGPGLHRDELRQTGRSPAPAIGHKRSWPLSFQSPRGRIGERRVYGAESNLSAGSARPST